MGLGASAGNARSCVGADADFIPLLSLQAQICRNDDEVPMDFQLYANEYAPQKKILTLPCVDRYSNVRFIEAERLLSAGLHAFQQPA